MRRAMAFVLSGYDTIITALKIGVKSFLEHGPGKAAFTGR